MCITHYASQQAVVGGRYPAMVVDGERGQCRDVDAELLVFGYVWRQVGVKAVYPFHNKHCVGRELHSASGLYTRTALEVVCG